MTSLARWMIGWRQALFGLGLLAVVAAWPLSLQTKSDQSVRSLFAPDHDRLAAYQAAVRDFGGDAVCLAVYRDPKLFSRQGMIRLRELRDKLAKVQGVIRANSLAEAPRPGPWLLPRRSLENWLADEQTPAETIRNEVLAAEMYADLFVGRDGETAAVVLFVDRESMESGYFAHVLTRLRGIVGSAPYNGQIVGTPALISDVYSNLAQDAQTLGAISSVTMLTVIFLLFGNLRWVALPVMVVAATLVWTRALMAASDIQLSIIGSMTTSLVTVIGIATSIHIAVRYGEDRWKMGGPIAGFEKTLSILAPAIFWTCATTAAGFGSLAVSKVTPVQEYAFLMGAASLFVGIAAFCFVPAGVLIGVRNTTEPPREPAEDRLANVLGTIGDWTTAHPAMVSIAMIVVLAISALGFQWIEVETDFTRNFRDDSSIIQGYRFVEDRLGGAGLIEITFPCPKSIGPEFLEKVRRCEIDLRGVPGVTKATGLPDFVEFFSQAVGSGNALNAFLSPAQQLQMRLSALQLAEPDSVATVWNAKAERMRIILRVREQQGMHGKTNLLAVVETTARRHLGDSAEVTGLYVLLIYLIDSLLGDQSTSFAVSALAIFGLTTIAFRSFRLGFIAFVPNLVPIIVVVGLMGWLGWPINAATAMIGSISMGLVVDFSIHYVTRFLEELRIDGDFHAALSRTHRSTGKAMVFANLALMLGFGVLTASTFVPTVHFGMLVSVAILGGLLGNLLLLPVLLMLAYRRTPIQMATAPTAERDSIDVAK